MSSILDAVNKNAERAGKVPLGSEAATGGAGGGNAPRPRWFRSVLAVVVVGLSVGALVARLFGNGEGRPESLLTNEVAGRAARPHEAADRPSARAQKPEHKAGSARTAGRRKGADDHDRKPRAAGGAHKKGKTHRREHQAGAKAGARTLAANSNKRPPIPGTKPAAASAVVAPASAPPVAPAVVVAPPAVVTAPTATLPTPVALTGAAGSGGNAAPPVAPTVKPGALTPTVLASVPTDPAAVASRGTVIAASPTVIVSPVPAAPTAAPASQLPQALPPTVEEPVAAVDDAAAGEPSAPTPVTAEPAVAVGERPAGAPEVALMFILWAKNPEQRMASMRVGTGSVTIIHEGEFIEGMQVSSIHADAVDFLWTGNTFRVHVRPF